MIGLMAARLSAIALPRAAGPARSPALQADLGKRCGRLVQQRIWQAPQVPVEERQRVGADDTVRPLSIVIGLGVR